MTILESTDSMIIPELSEDVNISLVCTCRRDTYNKSGYFCCNIFIVDGSYMHETQSYIKTCTVNVNIIMERDCSHKKFSMQKFIIQKFQNSLHQDDSKAWKLFNLSLVVALYSCTWAS